MKKHLELLFKDANGKSRKITIRAPKDNVTATQAKKALDNLVACDIFTGQDGEDLYVTAVGAQYVTRSVDTVYTNEAA